MSRITAVRSTTGTPSSFSRLRSWRGLSSSSPATTLAPLRLRPTLRPPLWPPPPRRGRGGARARRAGLLLEVALLARAQLVVDGDDVRVGALELDLELLDLA